MPLLLGARPHNWWFLDGNSSNIFWTIWLLWATVPSPCAQYFWLFPWRYGSVWTCNQIRLLRNHLRAAFKSDTEWNNAQYISASTTMILVTPVGSFRAWTALYTWYISNKKAHTTKILQNFWLTLVLYICTCINIYININLYTHTTGPQHYDQCIFLKWQLLSSNNCNSGPGTCK